MKFVNLIEHLKSLSKTQRLINDQVPNIDFGQIDTYLKDALSPESEVTFFDAEEMPNDATVEIEGVIYINLFPLPMLQEMVEDYSTTYGSKMTDLAIAQRILDYRIKDA